MTESYVVSISINDPFPFFYQESIACFRSLPSHMCSTFGFSTFISFHFFFSVLCYYIDFCILHVDVREVTQLYPTLCNLMDCRLPESSVHGIFQQEYWSGLPFPSPGDLPNPGIEPGSPALQADALPSEPSGKPIIILNLLNSFFGTTTLLLKNSLSLFTPGVSKPFC